MWACGSGSRVFDFKAKRDGINGTLRLRIEGLGHRVQGAEVAGTHLGRQVRGERDAT